MLYLNKLLSNIKKNPNLFKDKDIIISLGLSATHIKELKKYALENQLITQVKQEYFLTTQGEDYLVKNPLKHWTNEDSNFRPKINLEYLKEEKTPSILTKAMRLVAKNLIENVPLKEHSLEYALKLEISNCKKIISVIESEVLSGDKISLENIFEKYCKFGLTKSLISLVILIILTNNIDKIAIYEKKQFQLKLDSLMFDRIIACPQNFEIKKTEMPDIFILKDVSKIILNKKSNNILEITKGLYKIIKELDKYTMNTQNLSTKTLRLRNIIVNAKDPISLFDRDIPKVFGFKSLSDCERDFLNNLKISLQELQNCTSNLINDLKAFIYSTFATESKESLSERFLAIKDYIGEKELKVLFNTITDINITEDLWVNRIATFINTYRVPKDWSDEDYANFKVKAKELALKFFILESTIGTYENFESKKISSLLVKFNALAKQEKNIFLRKIINI